MKKKEFLVHLIHRDKFTTDYINFMKKSYANIKQYFFTLDRDFELQPCDFENVIIIKSYNELLIPKYHRILKRADKIIVSGVFRIHQMLAFVSKSVLRKTYLHFWGGDFYWAENAKTNKDKIKYSLQRYFINNCRATVNLVEGDVKVLDRLFPNNTLHYIAPVPRDPEKPIDYSEYTHYSHSKHKNIIIGNSGSMTNNHIEILKVLERFKTEDIDIYCPLSYTDSGEKYVDEVICLGKALFAQKFHEITNFMKKKQYLEFLSKMDIAIFNNNRQQGMGTISILLRMSKKVYLRTTTSMWERYKGFGYAVYPTEKIQFMDYRSFIDYQYEIYEMNLHKNTWEEELNRSVTSWNQIINEDYNTIHG